MEKNDSIHAYYDTVQSRLENTLSSLGIKSKALLSQDSRIRETNIALEMVEFVQNQILTQTAVGQIQQSQYIVLSF